MIPTSKKSLVCQKLLCIYFYGISKTSKISVLKKKPTKPFLPEVPNFYFLICFLPFEWRFSENCFNNWQKMSALQIFIHFRGDPCNIVVFSHFCMHHQTFSPYCKVTPLHAILSEVNRLRHWPKYLLFLYINMSISYSREEQNKLNSSNVAAW